MEGNEEDIENLKGHPRHSEEIHSSLWTRGAPQVGICEASHIPTWTKPLRGRTLPFKYADMVISC
jgi:hypothetical protein